MGHLAHSDFENFGGSLEAERILVVKPEACRARSNTRRGSERDEPAVTAAPSNAESDGRGSSPSNP